MKIYYFLIVSLGISILTGCSNSPSTSQSSLNKTGTALSGTHLSETTLNNSSVSSGTVSSTGNNIKLSDGYDIDFGTIELVSPVYTFTGNAPEGTTKIEIIPNGNFNKSYFLKEFHTGDSEFKTNFRLDYGNIGNGINSYGINFYLPNNEIKRGLLFLKTNYKEIDLGENIIYFDEFYLSGKNSAYYDFSGNVFINLYEKHIPIIKGDRVNNILIKNHNNFFSNTGILIYNKKEKYLLEAKEFSDKEEKDYFKKKNDLIYISKIYSNLYEFNGKLLIKGFPLLGKFLGGPEPMEFTYDKFNNNLKFSDSDGDVCWAGGYNIVYNTQEQKNIIEVYSDYGEEETTTIIKDNLKLEIMSDIKKYTIKKEEKIKYSGIKYKYYEMTNKNYKLIKEGHIYKDNKTINNVDCNFIELNFGININYDTKKIIIKKDDLTFTGSLDDMGNR